MTTEQLPQSAPEARTALDAKLANLEWSSSYLIGGADQKREFDELTRTIAKGDGDGLAAALAGAPLPDVPNSQQRQTVAAVELFRELGIADPVTDEILRGRKYSPEEVQATKNWKAAATADIGPNGFVERLNKGGAVEKQKLMIADAILTRAQQGVTW